MLIFVVFNLFSIIDYVHGLVNPCYITVVIFMLTFLLLYNYIDYIIAINLTHSVTLPLPVLHIMNTCISLSNSGFIVVRLLIYFCYIKKFFLFVRVLLKQHWSKYSLISIYFPLVNFACFLFFSLNTINMHFMNILYDISVTDIGLSSLALKLLTFGIMAAILNSFQLPENSPF